MINQALRGLLPVLILTRTMTKRDTEQRLIQLRKQLAMYRNFNDRMAENACLREIEILTRGVDA